MKRYILFYLLYCFNLQSQVIGTVENIQGKVSYFYENEKGVLEVYDEIRINQQNTVGKDSELTISLNDGTTIIFFSESNFYFNKFSDIYSIKPLFELTIEEGSFVIETGEIPKLSPDMTKIFTPSGALVVNGTAINANFNDGKTEIFLLTDSFGNKGNLDLISNEGETFPFEIDKGLSINNDGIQPTELNEQSRQVFEGLKTAIIETTIIDEKKLDNIYQEKLKTGKIKDQNGDGKVDQEDIDLLKGNILKNKDNKLNNIIASSNDNAEILTKIIENSDEDSASNILNKVVETKPKITEKVVENFSENNPTKLNNLLNKNEEFSNKIIQTIVNESDENTKLGTILANTDDSFSSKILNSVVENKSELVTKIISDSSKTNSNKITNLLNDNEELKIQVNESITKNIIESPNGLDQLKDLMKSVDSSIADNVVGEVAKNESVLVTEAISEILIEEPEIMKKKLTESIIKGNDQFSSLLIDTALESGNIETVANVVNEISQLEANINGEDTQIDIQEENIQNNQSRNLLSSLEKLSSQITTANIKLKQENPNLEIDLQILDLVNEQLVSPN